MATESKSIYQRAGEWGIPFGLYMACTAVASIFADKFPPLAYVFMILLVCTPIVVYNFQRRKFIEDGGFGEHSSLWMLGIMLFILGSVISGFIVYLVLQYIRPNYMYEQGQAAIDAYSKMPQMANSDMLLVLRRMVNERLMPSAIEVVFDAFWFIAFGGSVVSAITAIFARRSANKKGTPS